MYVWKREREREGEGAFVFYVCVSDLLGVSDCVCVLMCAGV